MMQEKIHDALNYIDDDMIEAVEALRSADAKKRKASNVYKLKPSMFVAAAAACMVIVAATTWAVSPFLRGMGMADTAAPEGGAVYDGGTTACGSALTGSGAPGAAATTDSESSTVLVRVTSVTEEGFAAVLLEGHTPEIDSDIKDIRGDGASGTGTEYVYIVYSEDMELVENPELSVGSVVRVEYSKVSASKITAEKIMPEDFEED